MSDPANSDGDESEPEDVPTSHSVFLSSPSVRAIGSKHRPQPFMDRYQTQ